jgi:hypothetical protein
LLSREIAGSKRVLSLRSESRRTRVFCTMTERRGSLEQVIRDLHHKKATTLQRLFEEAPDEGDAVLRHIDRHTSAARGTGRGRSRSRPPTTGRGAGELAAHRYPLRGSQCEGSRSSGPRGRRARGSGEGSDEEAGEEEEKVDGKLPPSGTVVYSSSTDAGQRRSGGEKGAGHSKGRIGYASLELLSVSRASDRKHKYTARFRVDGQDKAIHFGAVGASATWRAVSEAVSLSGVEHFDCVGSDPGEKSDFHNRTSGRSPTVALLWLCVQATRTSRSITTMRDARTTSGDTALARTLTTP